MPHETENRKEKVFIEHSPNRGLHGQWDKHDVNRNIMWLKVSNWLEADQAGLIVSKRQLKILNSLSSSEHLMYIFMNYIV